MQAKAKIIAFVSPELHKLDYNLWKKIEFYSNYDRVFLCTDKILKAKKFFNK